MSIEIDILNGDASWPRAKPLLEAVWRRDSAEKQPWADIEWARADLRVLLDAPDDGGLACHVGIHFRTITWNGHKVHVGGIGGVSTRADCRRRGYASLALEAAVHTIRANDAVKFAILFCEPHNFAFYQARGWHPFTGEVRCEQPSGPIIFDVMAPFVTDIVRAPRQGKIDLCGLPW
ncbi:GNAT family N-acetyltransferase [Bradyrhizobium sp. WSM 1704]|uniref:GNAT family N-acetyltransferase n=1 Tax=Bradyrhizobium semiaridum TaxID=2821404 RepID=UPI001CE32E16|nr:GNAT family N-acetyltransferase [Bradyrhizobium semiaridum]MCA6124782.1 GNAT family N-acetyltransferase [Bradyrhizobium semiaridum]